MKRHFLWFKFLWGLAFILISFLSLAAAFPKPFTWMPLEINQHREEEKKFLLNRIELPNIDSPAEPKRYSPIETAWRSYRAVSISA